MRDTFEHRGRTFSAETPYDDSHGAPWEECDGHGPVSEWKRAEKWSYGANKAPGEWVLHADRGSIRTYDAAEAQRIALRDGWGLAPADEAALAQRLGRVPTRRQIAAEAVRRDFEYLRRWCADQWHYVGVVVTLLDADDDATDETESLWGIESDSGDYLEETARELADQICARLDAQEQAEREAWADHLAETMVRRTARHVPQRLEKGTTHADTSL